MNILRPAIALIAVLALISGLVGCSQGESSSDGPVEVTDRCPEFSWSDLSHNWGPAQVAPEGLREVCIDETDAFSVELEEEQAQFPVTLTGSDGTQVVITSAERVLAIDISGSLASTVVALGAADQLVGRDSATSESQLQHLPLVAAENHILNVESILATQPDVVITDGSIGPIRVLDQLREVGIAVVVVGSSRGISKDSERISLVASALGIPQAGTELSSLLAVEVAATKQRIAAETKGLDKPRVAFLYLRGNAKIYYLLGEDSGVSDLVEAAGGVDVAQEQGIASSLPLTSEALLAIQPDVILTMTSGLESVGGIDGLRELMPQLSGVKAIALGNVISVPDEYVLRFTTYSPANIIALASALFGTSAPEDSP